MDTGLLKSWLEAWHQLGAPKPDEALYRRMIASWSEQHRHYHTLEHLRECLAQLESVRASAQHPAEIELALWFHDAVYDPRRDDNEERSANWARSSVLQAGLPDTVANRVQALVMATGHDAAPQDADMQLTADIDLSILGADPQRYDEFESQVRAEYAHVPHEQFRAARRRILSGFLARPRIYGTEHFHATREARARENLRRAIARLGG
jgi:predicted metal-dependent HD superfamily phosphohydrolase